MQSLDDPSSLSASLSGDDAVCNQPSFGADLFPPFPTFYFPFRPLDQALMTSLPGPEVQAQGHLQARGRVREGVPRQGEGGDPPQARGQEDW